MPENAYQVYEDLRDYEIETWVNNAGFGNIVPTAVTYCAAKFYVSTFTEGLAWELKETGAKMKAKVLAPAAAKTEFGMAANNDSENVVGMVGRKSFSFRLAEPLFPYAGNSSHNQQYM